MHEGVPPGGPLVPELLVRANAAVGNEETEAGLEVFGTIALTGTATYLAAHHTGPLAPAVRDCSSLATGAPALVVVLGGFACWSLICSSMAIWSPFTAVSR